MSKSQKTTTTERGWAGASRRKQRPEGQNVPTVTYLVPDYEERRDADWGRVSEVVPTVPTYSYKRKKKGEKFTSSIFENIREMRQKENNAISVGTVGTFWLKASNHGALSRSARARNNQEQTGTNLSSQAKHTYEVAP